MPEKEKEYILVNGDKTVFTTDREFAKEFLLGIASATIIAQPETGPETAPAEKPKGKRGGYHPQGEYEITQNESAFVIHFASGPKSVSKKMVFAAADSLKKVYDANGNKPVTISELHLEMIKNPDPEIQNMRLQRLTTEVMPIFKKTGVVDYFYGKHRLVLMKPKVAAAAPIETAPVSS